MKLRIARINGTATLVYPDACHVAGLEVPTVLLSSSRADIRVGNEGKVISFNHDSPDENRAARDLIAGLTVASNATDEHTIDYLS